MHIKYYAKNLFLLLSPSRKRLKAHLVPTHVHDRAKHPIKYKHYSKKDGWKAEKQGSLRYRDYDTYEEYLMHQQHKFSGILKAKGGFTNWIILRYRIKFYRRFSHLSNFLPKSAKILCAGARQGTEVEVLHDLGFKNSFGIDLNPGPDNKYVRVGDFMNLEIENASIDMIYSNCIDHAYNIEKFFAEHYRVLRPNGYALYDIAIQNSRAFEAVDYDSEDAVFAIMWPYFQKIIKIETEKQWKWVLLQKIV